MTMPKFEPVARLIPVDLPQIGERVWARTFDEYSQKSSSSNPHLNGEETPLHTPDQLTEAYEAGKREQAAELETAKADIATARRTAEYWKANHLAGNEQLAAEQAKNVGLRELVEHFALIDLGRNLLPGDFVLWVLRARKAIATPSDTSALEAMIAKAGERMRERSINVAWNNEPDCNGPIEMGIRALPGVTLEDLK